MARLHLLLLLFLALASLLSASAAAPADVEFVRSSCRSTRYPALCLHCLAGYAAAVRRSPRQLACAALNVSLARAQSASAFVNRAAAGVGSSGSTPGRGGGALRDCIQTVGDSVDQLRRSVKELARMPRRGSPEFAWHLGNAQTWVSAALTDDTTCLDGVAAGSAKVDPRLRAAIRGRILELAQVTSNALALINRMAAARH